MKELVQLKDQAIKLRKQGLSYAEILEQVPVAKSSLSLWFKDLPLSEAEKVVLKKRINSRITRGRINAAAANRKSKLSRHSIYLSEAKEEFQLNIKNPLFHTGIALYWAEGAKRNELFHFMNSDHSMVVVLLLWLECFTEYDRKTIGFRLYLHEPFQHDNWEEWWQKNLQVSADQFKKTIIKPSNLGIKKRPNYKGCLRVEVPQSNHLLMKMKYWQKMLVEHYQKQ